MIVPMKKAVVVTQGKDSLSALSNLRTLGVLHVEHQQPPKGKDVNSLLETISLFNQALSILSGIKTKPGYVFIDKEVTDGQKISRHIIDLYRHREQLTEYFRTISIRIKQYEEWGDFDPQGFTDLARNNIFAGLYQIPLKQLDSLPEDIVVNKLSVKGGVINCLLLRSSIIDIGMKEVPLPQMSLSQMLKRREEDSQGIRDIEQQLTDQLSYAAFLNKIKSSLQKELEFQEALSGMGQAETLTYISGYIPADSVEKLILQAHQEQWALAIAEPGDTDSVPTLIRNPGWISVVSPVFKFLEVFPEYHEWDISPVFVFFFSLFFGMLIGDAGYGTIYMLLTFWVHKKLSKKSPRHSEPAVSSVSGEESKKRDPSAAPQDDGQPIFFLFYLLSLCAIIWGLLTGTFFGQEWFLKIGYKPLVPALNNISTIQGFCFFVGALHLSVAHVWRAVIKLPSVAALADVGWICVIWSVFFLAKMLILGAPLPSFCTWLIISGISLVVLFNNPQKNILKVFNVDLITLALSLISSFGEVVSYIRLFAVGLAGVAIADTFNSMAAGIGVRTPTALLTSIFVVILGHVLCLVLGPLSVLVHGIRLNVLEFSSHANISWSGTAYKPLRE
ncbi:MAG: hypothetical protein Q7S42_06195 [Candidatus Omnitrophota bacterium]|nr:hypothetical protein [Candidatus Omnitrophota bacterium]